uniref:SANT domain-containing protein n=1 Tax=Caenorhabditis tropicalis TaxID=1561998 RepID=A0A1I7TVC0_9PELO
MDEEGSRSSLTDEEDYVEENDNGEDYEATIEEEELLDEGDYADELKDLEDEGEMSLEELQRKYGYQPAGGDVSEQNDSANGQNNGETSSAPNENFDSTILDMGNSLSGLDDDDDDYSPPDPWKRSIRVDPNLFQASVPEFEVSYSQKSTPREDDTTLWTKENSNQPDDAVIDKYLKDVVELRRTHEQPVPPEGFETRDDEDALCALYRNNFDTEKAKASFPFPHINAPFRTVRPDALGFDEKEHKIFEESIEMYGKDFSLISRLRLPYRKVGELIEYYYQWKLTPSYRAWRDAHPQHVPVVQPHLSAAWHQQAKEQETGCHGPTSFADASFAEQSTSEESSTLTN